MTGSWKYLVEALQLGNSTSIPTRELQLRRIPHRLVVPADEIVLQFMQMDLQRGVLEAVV